jgi:hypothetical protein
MRFACRPLLSLSIVLSVVLGAGILAGAAPAGADEAIQPNQHFLGLVNGSNVDPAVYVACPGPIFPGRTGPVVGGQHFSVAHVASGGGYTGLFSQVYAWFNPSTSGTAPVQVKFSTYGTEQAIPTSVQVPCGGTGSVQFSSCPYLAPCAFGWVPNKVPVRFLNIAVAPTAAAATPPHIVVPGRSPGAFSRFGDLLHR